MTKSIGVSLQLRHPQDPACDETDPGHPQRHDPRQPPLCRAAFAESRPQESLQHSDIDGHPSVAIVLKRTLGSSAAVAIEEVKKKLEQIKEESFPSGMNPGMNFEVTPLLGVSKDQGMIYAVIQTRQKAAR